jgi:cell division transport system permease protein
MWTFFKRIVTSGATNFWRSGAVSFATVLIMTVTLAIIGSLIFLSAILTNTLTAIEDKVDVNVYFTTATAEADILAVQSKLQALPQVAEVGYTTRDQALAEFRERHANDTLTLQALQELGNNPLEASLSVKATDPSEYSIIVDYLTSQNLAPGPGSIVDRINYFQNKTVIDRLTAAIAATEQVGFVIVILFALASMVIALGTIRLAIYTARDEIAVMRLVGASNMYIRGPFIVTGIIAGVVAAFIALILFFPATWYAGNALESWLGGFNLFTYYLTHFGYVFLVLVGSGIFLGALASWIGVRRYLKI